MTTTLRPTKTGWSARIRMGAGQRPWIPMPPMEEDTAERRRERLQLLAGDFVAAGKASEVEPILRDCAAELTPKAFDAAERAARKLLGKDAEPPPGPRTFRDIAELWLEGELDRRYPGRDYALQGKHKERVRTILDKTLYPVLGSHGVGDITLDHAEAAVAAIPVSVKSQGARRHFMLVIRRVLALAVYPLRLMTHSPIPPKWVPPQGKSPAFSYLFPIEDQQLVGHTDVPFIYRFFFGFLTRNGCRVSEALALTIDDIDRRSGILSLDENKTDDPRQWTLEPDVLRALERHLETHTDRRIFEGVDGHNVAYNLRRYLGICGVDRPQLHQRTNKRRPLRAHDLRATFVTLALASGRTETWVMDRTGHKSSQMVNVYRRAARSAAEANLGWLLPLDECLWPETDASLPGIRRAKGGPRVDQEMKIEQEMPAMGSTTGTLTGPHAPRKQPNSAAASRPNVTGQRLGPPSEGGVVQSPVEIAVKRDARLPAEATPSGLSAQVLEELLDLATKARRWHLVTALGAQIDALARSVPSNVLSLDDRRRGR